MTQLYIFILVTCKCWQPNLIRAESGFGRIPIPSNLVNSRYFHFNVKVVWGNNLKMWKEPEGALHHAVWRKCTDIRNSDIHRLSVVPESNIFRNDLFNWCLEHYSLFIFLPFRCRAAADRLKAHTRSIQSSAGKLLCQSCYSFGLYTGG